MRGHSLVPSFFTLSLLSTASALAHDARDYPTTSSSKKIATEYVTEVVTAYVTTCPLPPPPCATESGASPTEYPESPSSGYPAGSPAGGGYPSSYPAEEPTTTVYTTVKATAYTTVHTKSPYSSSSCSESESEAYPSSSAGASGPYGPSSYPTYSEYPSSSPYASSSPHTTYTSISYSSTFAASSSPYYPSSSAYPTGSGYSSSYESSSPYESSGPYSSSSGYSSSSPYSGSSSVYYSSTFSASTTSTYPTTDTVSYSSTFQASSPTSTYPTTTGGSPPACSDYWMENIKHQGVAPFAGSGYEVFRNVKKFGAKGDGVTDDTAAIQKAIAEGARCAPHGCNSTTKTPAVVYFPAGVYVVSKPIIDYYYTQIIGNPDCMPIIKVSSGFNDSWVFDGSQDHVWISTNIFWRQIRNLVIDMSSVSASLKISAFHWPTGQATSLQNIVVHMSTAAGNQHSGLFIEDGSGGYLGDMVFNGGYRGIDVGNQQFTMRNLTFNGCDTAIHQNWDWGWTYKGISINNCGVGLDMSATSTDGTNTQTVGSVVLIDSDIRDTKVAVKTGKSATSQPPSANALILENVRLSNVGTAVQGPGPTTLLAGGSTTVAAWGQGHRYGASGAQPALNGAFQANTRPAGLTAGSDFYERSKPQYEGEPLAHFVSVRSAGAKGDGVHDDAAIINSVLESAAAEGKIVYFDHGLYLVKSTIKIPPGSRVVGESYPVIMSSGSYFTSMQHPKPVVQVGASSGAPGTVEWSDMIVSTQGAQAGAILIEWNLASPASSPSGMWDVHTRVGGFAGSSLQLAECAKTPDRTVTTPNPACIAAFMSMHITAGASGLYLENVWLWVADHDIEDPQLRQITIYAGRGLLVESQAGNVWMYGTAVEHHQMYEYQLYKTRAVVMGQIQTETAYWQPNPDARLPFPVDAAYHDPTNLKAGDDGWGLRVVASQEVLVYGAGLYSFFNNYSTKCSDQGNGEVCQKHIFSVEGGSSVSVYNLNTVGTTYMVTVDGTDIAHFSDNLDGFTDGIALFRS